MNHSFDIPGLAAPSWPNPTARNATVSGGGEDFTRLLESMGAGESSLPPLDRASVNVLANLVRQILAQAQRAWMNQESNPGEEGGLFPPVMGNTLMNAMPRTPAYASVPMLHPPLPHPDLPPLANPAPKKMEGPTEAPSPTSLDDHPGESGRERFDPLIRKAAQTYGVDEHLIASVIQTESSFDPKAVSPVGARGLMQLMPATARDLGVNDPFDPEQNVMGGTRYLKKLLDRYHGERNLALAAYNWGMGNLERNPDAMPRETRQYIAKIDRLMNAVG